MRAWPWKTCTTSCQVDVAAMVENHVIIGIPSHLPRLNSSFLWSLLTSSFVLNPTLGHISLETKQSPRLPTYASCEATVVINAMDINNGLCQVKDLRQMAYRNQEAIALDIVFSLHCSHEQQTVRPQAPNTTTWV